MALLYRKYILFSSGATFFPLVRLLIFGATLFAGATSFFSLVRLFLLWRDFFLWRTFLFSGATFFLGATFFSLARLFLWRDFFPWRDFFRLARLFFSGAIFFSFSKYIAGSSTCRWTRSEQNSCWKSKRSREGKYFNYSLVMNIGNERRDLYFHCISCLQCKLFLQKHKCMLR